MRVMRYLLLTAFALSIGGLQARTLYLTNNSKAVIFVKADGVEEHAFSIDGKGQTLNKKGDKKGECKVAKKGTLMIADHGMKNMVIIIRGNNVSKDGKKITVGFESGRITEVTIHKGGSYGTAHPKM